MIRFRFFSSLLIGALGAASPAYAQQWRAAAENTDKPQTVMFVDEAGLTREKDWVTADVLTVMAEEEGSPRDWNYSILRRKVDCAKGQTQILTSRFFRDDHQLGEDNRASEWLPIREGSVFEGVADAMCGRQDYLTPVIENPVALSRLYFSELQGNLKDSGKTGGK